MLVASEPDTFFLPSKAKRRIFSGEVTIRRPKNSDAPMNVQHFNFKVDIYTEQVTFISLRGITALNGSETYKSCMKAYKKLIK